MIPGASVTVTGPGNNVKVGSTNQQGSYVINGLAPRHLQSARHGEGLLRL